MKTNYIFMIGVVCLMTSCVKENIEPVVPTPGKEVRFSALLKDEVKTRTIYGDEIYMTDEKGNQIKDAAGNPVLASEVFWVHNDNISIFGADCSVTQADYSVSTAKTDENGNETTEINLEQNYATSLTKLASEAAGVQWGKGNSDFYAIYPNSPNSFTKTTDGAEVVTSISTEQNIKFTLDGSVWKGIHYAGKLEDVTTTDAIMYACTPDAANGSIVNLRFKPFSNVLRFTFQGYQAVTTDADGNKVENANWDSEVYVHKIILTSPNEYIAGDFKLSINKSTLSATANPVSTNASKTITIVPNYLPLKNKEVVQFDVFTIPTNAVMQAETPWTVTLETTSGNFTYKMIPKVVNSEGVKVSQDVTLTAGQIHKVTVPQLQIEKEFEIPANNWIRYIPRNVYLSELSIPGAWYCFDTSYQGANVSMSALYEAGIRAFHFDCRVSPNTASGRINITVSDEKELVCAGTENASSELGLISGLDYTQGTSVKSKIVELITYLNGLTYEKVNEADPTIYKFPHEYAVIVLTICEKPCTWDPGTTEKLIGVNDPGTVLSYISTMLDDLRKTYFHADGTPLIYNEEITPNTTISDVLGHIIVKVNTNDSSFYSTDRGYSLPSTLISYGSMASLSEYISGNITPPTEGYFIDYQEDPCYWGNKKTDITSYYHQAQLTIDSDAASSSTTPSLFDRKKAIDDLLDIAYTDYSGNKHNGWYQLGIGGYTQTSNLVGTKTNHQNVVAQSLNPYVLDEWIKPKLAKSKKTINGTEVTLEPSPVGIVLMNYALDDATNGTNGKGLALVQAIRDMNSKFILNRNKAEQEWPDGNPFTSQTQAALATVSDASYENGGIAAE